MSDTRKVYRCHVGAPDSFGSVHPFIDDGEVVEIDGVEWVRAHGGRVLVEKRPEWKSCVAAAKEYGAEQIDGMIVRLRDKAAQMRKEAACETA